MSDIDVIIGNLNASVAELEKALALAESSGFSSDTMLIGTFAGVTSMGPG